MGGSSKSNSSKSNVLGNTVTSNPYTMSSTTNKGTTTAFQPNTAFETIYNSVNKNIGNLIEEYLNPTLNSTTNQAKLKSFTDTINNESYKNLENNIINPLAKRNMIRSSQATDMYNKNAQNVSSQIASYSNDLLADAQNQTANIINTLLTSYMQGYNAIGDSQAQSLNTSKANATSYSTSNTSNSMSIGNVVDALSKVSSIVNSFMGRK